MIRNFQKINDDSAPSFLRWKRTISWLIPSVLFILSESQSLMGSESKHAISEMTGTWNGTLHQNSHDTQGTFPMILTVNNLDSEGFSGTMNWPKFGNCQTRVRGYFNGSKVIFTETEYLKGNDVVLNGLYVARFSGKDTLKGEWMDPEHTINPKGPKYGVPGASFVLKRKLAQ